MPEEAIKKSPYLDRVPQLRNRKWSGMDPGEAAKVVGEILKAGKAAVLELIDGLREVDNGTDWKERLFKLVELGAGYVALPGGTGTLVELSVVWEWVNKRFISPRPIVLLGGYWHPVVDAVAQGEIWNHSPILRAPTPQEAADLLVKHFQESSG